MNTKTGNHAAEARRLGLEIREVRRARGLTLNELSGQVGCSVAYLSRIERGTANVSAVLLREISAALSVDPAWFFPRRAGAGPMERAHVVRAGNRRPLSGMYTRTADELGFSDELLSSTLSGNCYLLRSRFPAGKGAPPGDPENYAFDGEQHGIVTSGEILLILAGERIVLGTGDSFSYPSTIPHRFLNNADSEATLIWAMAPVRISW